MTALYLLGALLLVLLVAVVLAPLVEREPPDEALEELPPDQRHEAAVEALSEVEFEYRTDKLPEEEYRRLRAHYGRIALAAEDEMGGADGTAPARDDETPPDSAAGEAAPDSAAGGDARPSPGTGAPACPECGTDVPGGARYCPRCGAATGRGG